MRRPGASRGGGIEPGRQRPAKIDGRSRQNPAYRPGHFSRKGNSFRLFSFFFSLLAGRRGAFCWGPFVISFPFVFFKFLSYFSLRRARAARGPLLSAPAESRQRQAQGSFTPLRIPGPKWGAGRPPLETPKSRCAIRIGRTPRRFAAGASVPLGKAASACALATAVAPPPLRVGGFAPWPPTFPVRERLPIMRASAWYRVRNGFCGNAFANLPEAPAAKRLGVPSLPSRGCGRRPL